MHENKRLWTPSDSMLANSHLFAYMNWLNKEYGFSFSDYDSLWDWSVSDTSGFWASIWKYFDVISEPLYEQVLSDGLMPDVEWFTGAKLNYAEHVFRKKTVQSPAIIFKSEFSSVQQVSWKELEEKVSSVQNWMIHQGVKKGDRVVAYLPNIPEATITFLAANALGAVWSSCSPDFGSDSVIDRFLQIKPKIFITVDGYTYNGKSFNRREVVKSIRKNLPSLEKCIVIPHLNKVPDSFLKNGVLWNEVLATPSSKLHFERVDFAHPIWVLYSSGTTGIPKAITHSQGGVLLEHLKYLHFHNDVHPGECFFWYTTTGWMMWNFVQAALLTGASIVLYDGSPTYPDINTLWELSEEVGIQHFGTSAPFLVACMKKQISPGLDYQLEALRTISSTGAPLPPEAFGWIYKAVKKDVWLCSMSGGTDVCTAFVGGVPTEPVYRGEIQRRSLGCAVYAFDELGESKVDEVGEMVITKPLPSMPIYFWNDPGKKKYLSSYFEMYPGGIWRHGDWLKITSRNTLVILGRSDSTLNRYGIRIGTAEIYRTLDKIEGIKDSLIVNLELSGGRHFMPLFVLMEKQFLLDEGMRKKINQALRTAYSPRHVPDEIIEVADIPYTISGKKLEAPIKKILMGIDVNKAANKGAMRNPETLEFFVNFKERILEL